MTDPFGPCVVGGLRLRNRIVMAPMTRRRSPGGLPGPGVQEYYRRRAAGGVGLILSEGVGLDDRNSWDTPDTPRLHAPEHAAAWRPIVAAVHAGGGRFAFQLWHTGPRSHTPVGPSPAPAGKRWDGSVRPPVEPLDAAGLERVAGYYARAAARAREAGADAVEIHGAHGYLLDSFLNPAVNRREDGYGGTLEGRMRFPLDVVRAVRAAVGPDYPVLYRFSRFVGTDAAEQAFPDVASLAQFTAALRDAGVDILHASTRAVSEPIFPEAPGGPLPLGAWVRLLTGRWTAAVGGVSLGWESDGSGGGRETVVDPGPALDLVRHGGIDLLVVGRALIANPDWVRLVESGRWRDLRPYAKDLLGELA